MKLEKLGIGFGIAAIVFIVGLMAITDLDKNYSEFSISQSENDTYNNLSRIANKLWNDTYQDTKSQVDDISGDNEVDENDRWESMLEGAYSAVKLVIGFPLLADEALGVVQKEVGFPPIFKTLAWLVMFLTILFSVIYILFRIGT